MNLQVPLRGANCASGVGSSLAQPFTSNQMAKTPTVPDDTHNGLTWRDMPGGSAFLKKGNFSLFKRGLYKLPKSTAFRINAQGKRIYNAYNPGKARRKLD